jgi:hypothetical protein
MAGGQTKKKSRPLGPKAVKQTTFIKPKRVCCACLGEFPARAPKNHPEKPPYMLALTPFLRRLKKPHSILGVIHVCEPCFQYVLFGDGKLNSQRTQRFFARFRDTSAAAYYELLPPRETRNLARAVNQ